MDLYSINYLHHGRPKFWYGVPTRDCDKFDSFTVKCFPERYKRCQEFMRHKTFIINPGMIVSNGITVNKAVQKPGEFMVTFKRAYHLVFNVGFNIAEAVNFITDSWFEYGKLAGVCMCKPDSVKIDIENFQSNCQKTIKNPLLMLMKLPSNSEINLFTDKPSKKSTNKSIKTFQSTTLDNFFTRVKKSDTICTSSKESKGEDLLHKKRDKSDSEAGETMETSLV